MNLNNKLNNYIENRYPKFGVNKKQEIIRLVYEIAKREGITHEEIINKDIYKKETFESLKKRLLKRRFPTSYSRIKNETLLLQKLDLSEKFKVKIIKPFKINPKKIIIEKNVRNSELALKFTKNFTKAKIEFITNISELSNNTFALSDFNKRIETFILVEENFQHYLKCPCTKDAVCCNYNILNLGFGCGYECTYCILQAYTNSPGIIIPANINDFLNKLDSINAYKRIGSGQFSDSLIYDNITGYSQKIINHLRNKPNINFEFKTKSNNIDLILECDPIENVTISWSVNPQSIIQENEFHTTSLDKRLSAAKQISGHGFNVGFHFDPIIYSKTWEIEYSKVIQKLFDKIDAEKIKLISLGTLRFTKKLKTTIESRFPDNNILYEEFLLGYDNKLRYPDELRKEIYTKMYNWIRKRSKSVIVYLCMESKSMYDSCNIPIKSF